MPKLMRLYPVTNNNGRWSPDEGEQRCGRCAKTTCVGLSSGVNKRQGRCRAILIQPKAGVAACLAMIPFARKKQPVQPQSQAMGVALAVGVKLP